MADKTLETESKPTKPRVATKPPEKVEVVFENTLVWEKKIYEPGKSYTVLKSEFAKMVEIPSAANKELPIVRKV